MTRLVPLADGSFNPHVPGIDYGVLDSLVGYGVRRAQIAIYNDFLSALEAWNITPPRFSAMVIIHHNEGLKLTELAQVLGIARSGVVALVDTLSEMGYVERLDVPGDRRAYGLALTALGRNDLRKIEQAVLKQDQRDRPPFDGGGASATADVARQAGVPLNRCTGLPHPHRFESDKLL